MSVDDLGGLVARAKSGEVTQAELRSVATELESATSDGGVADRRVYRLLYVLGRSGATQYADLVARFLTYPSEPSVSALALQLLCSQWQMGERFRPDLLAAMRGLPWDDGDLRSAALSAAGAFLRRSGTDREVLEALVEAATEPDGLDRMVAIESLAKAAGHPDADIYVARSAALADDWQRAVLAESWALLEQ